MGWKRVERMDKVEGVKRAGWKRAGRAEGVERVERIRKMDGVERKEKKGSRIAGWSNQNVNQAT